MKKLVSTLLLATTMIFSACNSSTVTTDQTANTTSELSSATTAETSATETTFDYNLNWTKEKANEFAKYYEGNYHITLGEYIYYLGGFSDDISYSLTNFVNYEYKTNFDNVPFSAVGYLRTYVIGGNRAEAGHFRKPEMRDVFCKCYLEGINPCRGTLTNKAVVSYLYVNNIPLGKAVPLENLKALQVKDMNSLVSPDIDLANWILHKYPVNDEEKDKNVQHNISASTKFTNEELCRLLLMYNWSVRDLAADERILDLDLFSENPRFKDIGKEAIEGYNKILDEYYGSKGLRFGEIPTLEQFRYVYNDAPLDLTYIPGAVISPKTVIAYPDGSVAEVK